MHTNSSIESVNKKILAILLSFKLLGIIHHPTVSVKNLLINQQVESCVHRVDWQRDDKHRKYIKSGDKLPTTSADNTNPERAKGTAAAG